MLVDRPERVEAPTGAVVLVEPSAPSRSTGSCKWCGAPLPPRRGRGGRPAYCCDEHRTLAKRRLSRLASRRFWRARGRAGSTKLSDERPVDRPPPEPAPTWTTARLPTPRLIEPDEDLRPEWMALAACRDRGDEFYPPTDNDGAVTLKGPALGQFYAAARAICDECPSLVPCREWGDATEREPLHGMLGGEMVSERKRRRQAARRDAA